MFLSDFIRNNSLLQALAGAGLIAGNDLVQINQLGQAASVQTSDYAAAAAAGSTPFPQVQYSAASRLANGSNRRSTVVAADGSVYVADTDSAGFAGIWKYAAAGARVNFVRLSASANINSANVDLQILSNGDLVALWSEGAGLPTAVTFAIVDPTLAVIRSSGAIGSAANNPGDCLNLLALSGGGFCAVWTWAGNGVYYAIYNNAGAAVQVAAALAGVPAQTSGNALGAAATPRELSNGNIVIGIADSFADKLGFAIVQPTGAVVVAYANIAGAPATQNTDWPEVSVLPGYFAITTGRGGGAFAIFVGVYSNAGALQGASYNVATGGGGACALTNDGTSFWLAASPITADFGLVRIGVTGGASAVVTLLVNLGFPPGATLPVSMDYDASFGVLVLVANVGGMKALCLLPNAATGHVTAPFPAVGTGAHADCLAKLVGDGCIILGSGGYLEVFKYLNTAIIGVAAQGVAAGNAGTPFLFSMGPGGFQANSFRGSPGLAFDHLATTVLGNKGTLIGGRSVSLRGI